MIHSHDQKLAELLGKCLAMIGCSKVRTTLDTDEAEDTIDSFEPALVIIVSDINSKTSMEAAKRVNQKRVHTNRRTPKVLALLKPSGDDIVTAKEKGFYDVLPLPLTPETLRGRIETIMQRVS